MGTTITYSSPSYLKSVATFLFTFLDVWDACQSLETVKLRFRISSKCHVFGMNIPAEWAFSL